MATRDDFKNKVYEITELRQSLFKMSSIDPQDVENMQSVSDSIDNMLEYIVIKYAEFLKELSEHE